MSRSGTRAGRARVCWIQTRRPAVCSRRSFAVHFGLPRDFLKLPVIRPISVAMRLTVVGGGWRHRTGGELHRSIVIHRDPSRADGRNTTQRARRTSRRHASCPHPSRVEARATLWSLVAKRPLDLTRLPLLGHKPGSHETPMNAELRRVEGRASSGNAACSGQRSGTGDAIAEPCADESGEDAWHRRTTPVRAWWLCRPCRRIATGNAAVWFAVACAVRRSSCCSP